jgi:hypothetical protein
MNEDYDVDYAEPEDRDMPRLAALLRDDRHHWGAGVHWTRAWFGKYVLAPTLLVAFCLVLFLLHSLGVH